MPARARIEKLVILDEPETRMRRVAARLSRLASGVAESAAAPEGAVVAARYLQGASALAGHVPELRETANRLAEAVSALEPRPGMSAETAACVALAELERAASGDGAALERAAVWARRLSSAGGAPGAPEPGELGPRAALALAKAAAATGEARFREAAEREIAGCQAGDKQADFGDIVTARALAALGCADGLERAKAACGRAASCRDSGAPESAGSDPAATAEGALLACDLWAAEQDARYLDAIERAALNGFLFEQTDDGGAVAGRTLDGDAGEIDDAAGTPALASGLACAARHSLFADAEGRIVGGLAANAVATVRVGQSTDMRCIVSTQRPVRGWTKWTFEPLKPSAAPSVSTSTLRPARRKRMVTPAPEAAEKPERGPAEEAATFAFHVRVPGWVPDSKDGPVVKIDRQKVKAKCAGGFLVFEVPTGRVSEIEVVFKIRPGSVDRQSPVSWAKEIAVTYGPSVLTASARLNPGENLGMPLRIVSPVEEFNAVADVRRRLPVVEAKALGGGGRVVPILFSPLSEVGGLVDGPGAGPVRCAPFRTWHRLGR